MEDKEECNIIECRTEGGRIYIEIEYTVGGVLKRKGIGFSQRAFESGVFMDVIHEEIQNERKKEISDTKNKIDMIKGQKIDLENKRVIGDY